MIDYNYFIENKIIDSDKETALALKFIFDRLPSLLSTLSYSSVIKSIFVEYRNYPNRSNSLNGIVFESLLAAIFLKTGVQPIFVQAEVVYVPNVHFDFLLHSKKYGPISISAKTSLRERYKQADLEAIVLKNVHRNAKAYLVTLNESEAATVQRKVESLDVIGIDQVIVATAPEFDEFLQKLQGLEFDLPGKVDVVTAQKVIGSPSS